MGQMTRLPRKKPEGSWRMWHYLALLGVARTAISSGVAGLGLLALSDDDYARVTIAERFAVEPKLDPSGTSWLPFPFWVAGGTMKLLDPSLDVARLTAGATAIGATWLLFAAGRLWGFSRRRAFVAALLANLLPQAAMLGSLTTPEFPTAALALFAVLAVTAPRASRSVGEAPRALSAADGAAALAMLAATLSRYEAWPVAFALAAYVWLRRGDSWKARAAGGLALLVGPIWWLADNRLLHGDAFSFVRRVASYRAALGASAPTGYVGLLAGAVVLVLVWFFVRRTRVRDRGDSDLSALVPWAACALCLSFFLASGELLGGAPTHHPERALLLVWFLALFAFVHLVRARRPPALLVAVAALLLAIDGRSQLSERGIDRRSEEAIGGELRALVSRGERVYVATKDYGYFAVIASFGRPFDTKIDQTHDPRDQSSQSILDDRQGALDRLQAERASWLVAPRSALLPFALRVRSRVGELSIFELDMSR